MLTGSTSNRRLGTSRRPSKRRRKKPTKRRPPTRVKGRRVRRHRRNSNHSRRPHARGRHGKLSTRKNSTIPDGKCRLFRQVITFTNNTFLTNMTSNNNKMTSLQRGTSRRRITLLVPNRLNRNPITRRTMINIVMSNIHPWGNRRPVRNLNNSTLRNNIATTIAPRTMGSIHLTNIMRIRRTFRRNSIILRVYISNSQRITALRRNFSTNRRNVLVPRIDDRIRTNMILILLVGLTSRQPNIIPTTIISRRGNTIITRLINNGRPIRNDRRLLNTNGRIHFLIMTKSGSAWH